MADHWRSPRHDNVIHIADGSSPSNNLTAEILRERVSYDPITGEFRWKNVVPCGVAPGQIAGCDNKKGYWKIVIDRRGYLAHRLAWLHVYGKWPDGQIDHIDRNKMNNSIANLREATHAQNSHNRGDAPCKGYKFHKKAKKFYAQISVDGKKRHLGSFDRAEDAHAVYMAAKSRYHGEFCEWAHE